MRAQHQEGVGAEIARLRAERGWSQRELARVVGLDQSAVSRIEAGRRRVSAAELHQFADVFRVSADTLLAGSAGAAESRAVVAGWSTPDLTATTRPSAARAGYSASNEGELLDAIARARTESAAAGEASAPSPAAPHEDLPARPQPSAHGFAAGDDRMAAPPVAQGPPGGAARSRARLGARLFRAASERATSERPASADPGPDAEPGPDSERPLPEQAMPWAALTSDRILDQAALSATAPAPRMPPPATVAAPAPAAGAPAPPAPLITGEGWAAEIAGVVRDWFELRRLAAEPGLAQLWSTGQTADGRPAQAARPWQPVIPAPGSGDVLYDRVARFWRGELHVDPDDGPLPDLVPLLEDGLGIQAVVARIQSVSQTFTTTAGLVSDPRPVAATVVSDDVPFVFVNAGRPVVLQRFALVHSFAHLALGHGDVVDESIGWSRANPREAAANDFAEEFLAPVRAVERWYGRRPGLPRSPSLDTLLELANAFGISAWAALFRSRAAGRLNPKQFTALRVQMRGLEWQLLPRQAFLGGLKDTLAHLTPAEVVPVGTFGPPAVLRVPACMRAWALALVRDGRLSLEDAAAMLRLRPSALAHDLDRLGLE